LSEPNAAKEKVTAMSEWVTLLTGLPSDVAAVQSLLNANGIPTFTMQADPYTGTMSLLVPASKFEEALQLLQQFEPSTSDDEAADEGNGKT
jgi:type III secretory pathway lipoprotein EscJ